MRLWRDNKKRCQRNVLVTISIRIPRQQRVRLSRAWLPRPSVALLGGGERLRLQPMLPGREGRTLLTAIVGHSVSNTRNNYHTEVQE